jgi:hypothetical protein
MRVRATASLGLPLILVLVACSAASPSPSPSGSPPPTSTPSVSPSPSASPAATLVLRVTTEGGFIGPAANLAALPEVSVYSDGRILTPGAIDAIYPGPLLTPVSVRSVGAAGAAAIAAAIQAAGLDKPGSGPTGGVPGDTGTTVFQYIVNGASITNRLVLGGGGPGRPGGVGSPDPQAAAASELLTRLMDPNETWGGKAGSTTTLTPTAFRIYVAPGAPVGDASTTEPTVAWPLAMPLDEFGVPAVPDRGIAGLRQGAPFGADATTLAPIFARSNALTPFSSGGKLYTLYVRALLPDEVPAQG